MTDQERIVLIIAELKWLINYYTSECSSDYCVDSLELAEDLCKMDNALENILSLLPKVYEENTTVSHSNEIECAEEPKE